jgi:hypothetical protein
LCISGNLCFESVTNDRIVERDGSSNLKLQAKIMNWSLSGINIFDASVMGLPVQLPTYFF